jgi:hypothetical protein
LRLEEEKRQREEEDRVKQEAQRWVLTYFCLMYSFSCVCNYMNFIISSLTSMLYYIQYFIKLVEYKVTCIFSM